jgi:hypothetical protein
MRGRSVAQGSGGCPSLGDREGTGAAARGRDAREANGEGRRRPPGDAQGHHLARHPGHHRPPDPRRSRPQLLPRRPGPGMPRGRGPLWHDARAREGASTPAARRRKASRSDGWRRPRHPQPPREAAPRAARGSRAAEADHQPPRRHQARRLPLARAPAHGRARQLHLPQLPPQLGAGSATRARGAAARRCVPPLHLVRRRRGSGGDAGGAAGAAPGWLRCRGPGA